MKRLIETVQPVLWVAVSLALFHSDPARCTSRFVVDEQVSDYRIVCPDLAAGDSLVSYTWHFRWAGQSWCLTEDSREAALDTLQWSNLAVLRSWGEFSGPLEEASPGSTWGLSRGDTIVIRPFRRLFDETAAVSDTVFAGEWCEFYFEATLASGGRVVSDTTRVYFDNLSPAAPGRPSFVADE